jgi:hypothetical protein
MSRSVQYAFLGLLIPAILFVLPLVAQKGAQEGQWPFYSSDHGSTGYSAVDLINRDNVKNLQTAWSWKFDNFGNTGTEVTPIMVNGILYFPLSPPARLSPRMREQAKRFGHGSRPKMNAKRAPLAPTRAVSLTGKMARKNASLR